MNSKLIGGTLLVIGTTIGAGILALPIATAELGFLGSMLLLIGAWSIMTICAFLFLEVNLWLPENTNLISMAGATLGSVGQSVTWLVYLVLLYSIICAYIAGGGDLFHFLLTNIGIQMSVGAASVVFTMLFGAIVYFGIRAVDYVNRGLMFGKMGAYVLLVLLIIPFVSAANLASGEFQHIMAPSSITVITVAFASLMVIPSLRTYFGKDVKTLRKSIFIGMTIPLLCYIAWDMAILGVVPMEGSLGLKTMLHSATSNSDLVTSLESLLQKSAVTSLAKFFTSICMTTSFLSISLCLSDFLADGLRMRKAGKSGVFIFLATFLPPLLVVLLYPNGFLMGLTFAGVCCFILFNLLPPVMVWRGRYHLSLSSVKEYRAPGGKLTLAIVSLVSTGLICLGLVGLYDALGSKFLLAVPVFFVTLLVGYFYGRGRNLSVNAQTT